MSTERDRAEETFLGRWSRLKTTAPADAPEKLPRDGAPAATPSSAETEPPPLPPIDELTMESDYRGFLHPKVDEGVRRAALRKLFSDPHFNIMDGLDVYIDDYSKADPIPPEMLASLTQARRIIDWAAEKKEDVAEVGAQPAQSPDALELAHAPVVSSNAAAPADVRLDAGGEATGVADIRNTNPD